MKKHLLLICIFLCAPLGVSAATLSLSAEPRAAGVGDTLAVTLAINSDISVNAFSGTLVIPSALTPLAVNDGSSIVSVWLTRPSVEQHTGSVAFAGFTPGGYTGRGGKIFSILFRVTTPGIARISLERVEVLRNDGEGTSEPVTLPSLVLSLRPVPGGGFTEATDTDPPEPFVAYPTLSPWGQHSLTFSAVDKISGIDHYEVAESRLPFTPLRFAEAESPYLIADQNLTSDVYIKAVDRAGNERLTFIPRTHLLNTLEWILGCILVVCGYTFIYVYWLRRS